MANLEQVTHDERGLISGLIFEPKRIGSVSMILTTNDFVDEAHGELFGLLVDLHDSGVAVNDTHVVLKHARDSGLIKKLGGMTAFSRDFVGGMGGTSANVTHYAAAIRDRSINRKIDEFAGILRNERMPADQRLDWVEAEVAAIRSQLQAGSTESTIREMHAKLFDDIKASKIAGSIPTIKTGLSCLDESYGGLSKDTLTVMAARPSVGKSALAFQIARNVADAGGNVRFVSLEMSREELAARDVAARTGINSKLIGTHTVSKDQLHQMMTDTASVNDNLVVDAPFGRQATIGAICAAAKVQHRATPLSLLVVDYIQIIMHTDAKERDYDRTTRAVRRLRNVARELDCPVIALSQLNRDSIGPNTEPGLHHLRESGAIEQDANNVLMLHRPDKDPHETKLIAAKWRGADRGKFNLWLDGPSTKFVEECDQPPEDHPNYSPEFAEWN